MQEKTQPFNQLTLQHHATATIDARCQDVFRFSKPSDVLTELKSGAPLTSRTSRTPLQESGRNESRVQVAPCCTKLH